MPPAPLPPQSAYTQVAGHCHLNNDALQVVAILPPLVLQKIASHLLLAMFCVCSNLVERIDILQIYSCHCFGLYYPHIISNINISV